MFFLRKIGPKTLINVGDISHQINYLYAFELIHGQVFTLKDVFVGFLILDAKDITLAWPENKEKWLLLPKIFLAFVIEELTMNCWDQINLRLYEILNVALGLF